MPFLHEIIEEPPLESCNQHDLESRATKETTHEQPYKNMSMVGIQNRPPFDIELNKA